MNICSPGVEFLIQSCCNFVIWLIEKNILMPVLIIFSILLLIMFVFMFRNGD